MARREREGKHGEAEILLGLLDAVERDGRRSQRGFASELDIALGLVNAYLARCIKKGWVKARGAPGRRYFYYLTPRGFAEKSRLTVQFLTSSFGFFREAKQDYLTLFAKARKEGFFAHCFGGPVRTWLTLPRSAPPIATFISLAWLRPEVVSSWVFRCARISMISTLSSMP